MKKIQLVVIMLIFIAAVCVLAAVQIKARKKRFSAEIKKTEFSGKSYCQIKKLLGEEHEILRADGKTVRKWKKNGYELELVFDEKDDFSYISSETIG